MWALALNSEQPLRRPYLTLSSLRLSMLRGFLLSARIFFFFSLSVCLFAPLFPSCWTGGIDPRGCVEKKGRKHQRVGNYFPTYLKGGDSGFFLLSRCQNIIFLWCFGGFDVQLRVMTDPLLDTTILLSPVRQNLLLLGILILLPPCLLLLLPLLFLLRCRLHRSQEKKHHLSTFLSPTAKPMPTPKSAV